MNLTNCPSCGKVMVKGARAVCPACHQEIEQQYEACMKFLRENRRCSMQELSDETGVSVNQIARFIREGRISIAELPNLSYECEVCGTSIREGHLCESCRQRLVREVDAGNERLHKSNESNRGSGFIVKE